ncbi:MAG: LysM domain/BON superfamily protein [Microgenomates bacterium OLB23]|nr:MAG: LysM domain/BON superfamily protein [Microgenomates bacterium OLB23]
MAQKLQSDAYREELINKIKENYLSVALGFLVFLVAVTLIYRSTSARQKAQMEQDQAQEQMEQKTNVHVVKAGESVSSIARDVLGSTEYADEIIAANSLKNPEVIEVGQELILPEVSGMQTTPAVTQPAATAAPTAAPAVKMEDKGGTTTSTTTGKITANTYVVQKGDTLMTIAERAYGNKSMYTRIMSANGIRNMNRIEVGMTLKLPR